MIKKFLIGLVVALALFGALGLYSALKYRDQLRQERQIAKAPEQSITIIEGWTNRDIAGYLQKNGISQSADFLNAANSFDASGYSFLAGKPKSAGLEGFLFPDTYFIPTSGTDINKIIIEKALDNFNAKVTDQMRADADARGLSLFQIITLASIVEKEAGAAGDRKTIAGIFYNRLNLDMPLQSDATVDFATGKNASQASLQDIQIDSPYNTYKYKGLPPGPICNPSLSSIMAAIYPQTTDYLYFLTDPATGRAIYAVTYDEQIANKQKYLKQ